MSFPWQLLVKYMPEYFIANPAWIIELLVFSALHIPNLTVASQDYHKKTFSKLLTAVSDVDGKGTNTRAETREFVDGSPGNASSRSGDNGVKVCNLFVCSKLDLNDENRRQQSGVLVSESRLICRSH